MTGELQLNAGTVHKVPFDLAGNKPGCRMYGLFELHKVDGNFHVAFGKIAEAKREGRPVVSATQQQTVGHTHRFTVQEMKRFNASHTVNHVCFGDARRPLAIEHPKLKLPFQGSAQELQDIISSWDPFASAPRQPMDGEQHRVPDGYDAAKFWYMMQVVPVRRVWADGTVQDDYEYTYQMQATPINYGPRFTQPGVFFRYHISPYIVVHTQEERSLYQLIARCLAVFCGAFAICGSLASATGAYIDRVRRPHTRFEATTQAFGKAPSALAASYPHEKGDPAGDDDYDSSAYMYDGAQQAVYSLTGTTSARRTAHATP